MIPQNISTHDPDYSLPIFLACCLSALVLMACISSSSGGAPIRRERRHVRSKEVAVHPRLTRLRGRQLPQELIDQIIDFLRDDKRALAACKHAHRTLSRAGMHLHRSLTLRRGGLDPYKLRFFLPMAGLIRELVVARRFLKEITTSVLVEIDKVESLVVLQGGDFFDGRLDIRASQFPRFSNLKTLALRCWCFHSATDLFSVIATSPNVTELAINLEERGRNGNIQEAKFQDALARCRRLRLATLELAFQLRHDDAIGSLTHIALGMAGPTTKHLIMDLRDPQAARLHKTWRAINTLDLSQVVSLETLCIKFCWNPSLWLGTDDIRNEEIRQASELLSHIPSHHLREISLHIVLGAEPHRLVSHLRHFNVDWIDHIVNPVWRPGDSSQQTQVQKLARAIQKFTVVFTVAEPAKPKELAFVHTHILAQLPTLTSRGILDLQVS